MSDPRTLTPEEEAVLAAARLFGRIDARRNADPYDRWEAEHALLKNAIALQRAETK